MVKMTVTIMATIIMAAAPVIRCFLQASILSSLHTLSHFIFVTTLKVETVVILILQLRETKSTERLNNMPRTHSH